MSIGFGNQEAVAGAVLHERWGQKQGLSGRSRREGGRGNGKVDSSFFFFCIVMCHSLDSWECDFSSAVGLWAPSGHIACL